MITHTTLSKIAFIEAVKHTDTYIGIKNTVFQALIVKHNRIDVFYENYCQAVKYGIDYIRQKQSVLRRDVQIINEILNK